MKTTLYIVAGWLLFSAVLVGLLGIFSTLRERKRIRLHVKSRLRQAEHNDIISFRLKPPPETTQAVLVTKKEDKPNV